jgi:hypothetical protein
MKPAHLEVLVEEPSAEEALKRILPGVLGETSCAIYRYEGKKQLLQRLPQRLRGYARWLPPQYRILVLVDRDDDDCQELKARLEAAALSAGLTTRSRRGDSGQVVTRIAVEELEAWFFGDWDAVRAAYPRVKPNVPARQPYRDPDAIQGGTWEALERILKKAGYFRTGLRKIEAARAIATHMEPHRNRSASFRTFLEVLEDFAES